MFRINIFDLNNKIEYTKDSFLYRVIEQRTEGRELKGKGQNILETNARWSRVVLTTFLTSDIALLLPLSYRMLFAFLLIRWDPLFAFLLFLLLQFYSVLFGKSRDS